MIKWKENIYGNSGSKGWGLACKIGRLPVQDNLGSWPDSQTQPHNKGWSLGSNTTAEKSDNGLKRGWDQIIWFKEILTNQLKIMISVSEAYSEACQISPQNAQYLIFDRVLNMTLFFNLEWSAFLIRIVKTKPLFLECNLIFQNIVFCHP